MSSCSLFEYNVKHQPVFDYFIMGQLKEDRVEVYLDKITFLDANLNKNEATPKNLIFKVENTLGIIYPLIWEENCECYSSKFSIDKNLSYSLVFDNIEYGFKSSLVSPIIWDNSTISLSSLGSKDYIPKWEVIIDTSNIGTNSALFSLESNDDSFASPVFTNFTDNDECNFRYENYFFSFLIQNRCIKRENGLLKGEFRSYITNTELIKNKNLKFTDFTFELVSNEFTKFSLSNSDISNSDNLSAEDRITYSNYNTTKTLGVFFSRSKSVTKRIDYLP